MFISLKACWRPWWQLSWQPFLLTLWRAGVHSHWLSQKGEKENPGAPSSCFPMDFTDVMGLIFLSLLSREIVDPRDAAGKQIVFRNTEAYVFLLRLKKIWAAQKCDLVHGKWDHRGSGFGMLLSYAWAKPATGMHSHTRVSGTGVSTKWEKEQRWGSISKESATSLLSIPTKRKSPMKFSRSHIKFLRTLCNKSWYLLLPTCGSNQARVPPVLTQNVSLITCSLPPCSSVGRKVSGKKFVPG